MPRSKYGNKRSPYGERLYDSRKEADHAATLDLLRAAKDPAQRVSRVIPQYRMPLIVNGSKIGHYVADFYVEFADGRHEIQDVKGFKTPMYRIKKKLVKALYNETIVEI